MARDVTVILAGFFTGGPIPSDLYIGFVSGTNFETYDRSTDEMSSHPGWEEFVAYDEAARPLWDPGAVNDDTTASVVNPAKAIITPNVNDNIVGFFLCDDDTKGGTTGQLYGPWSLDTGPQATQAGQPFNARITIELVQE